MTICSFGVDRYQYFGATCYLHLQDAGHYTPDDSTLHIHHLRKSYLTNIYNLHHFYQRQYTLLTDMVNITEALQTTDQIGTRPCKESKSNNSHYSFISTAFIIYETYEGKPTLITQMSAFICQQKILNAMIW
jgi:hypothetical protein